MKTRRQLISALDEANRKLGESYIEAARIRREREDKEKKQKLQEAGYSQLEYWVDGLFRPIYEMAKDVAITNRWLSFKTENGQTLIETHRMMSIHFDGVIRIDESK